METLPFEEEYCLSRLLTLVYPELVEPIIEIEVTESNINFIYDTDTFKIQSYKNKWEFIAKAKIWAYDYEPDAINIIESSYLPDDFGITAGTAYLKHFEDDEDKCFNTIYYGKDEFEAVVKALKNILSRGDFKRSSIKEGDGDVR